jgi:hypothetical protein
MYTCITYDEKGEPGLTTGNQTLYSIDGRVPILATIRQLVLDSIRRSGHAPLHEDSLILSYPARMDALDERHTAWLDDNCRFARLGFGSGNEGALRVPLKRTRAVGKVKPKAVTRAKRVRRV